MSNKNLNILKKLHKELVTQSFSSFSGWRSTILMHIENSYGKESPEYRQADQPYGTVGGDLKHVIAKYDTIIRFIIDSKENSDVNVEENKETDFYNLYLVTFIDKPTDKRDRVQQLFENYCDKYNDIVELEECKQYEKCSYLVLAKVSIEDIFEKSKDWFSEEEDFKINYFYDNMDIHKDNHKAVAMYNRATSQFKNLKESEQRIIALRRINQINIEEDRGVSNNELEIIFGYKKSQRIIIYLIDRNLIDCIYKEMNGHHFIADTSLTADGIDIIEQEETDVSVEIKAKKEKKMNPKNIFIVHGHDKALKLEIKEYITKLELNPIILHEQSNKGNTIIEKFENNSDVACAIILLTDDDLGNSKAEADKNNLNPRARQNVIFEMGYFFSKLGRSKVICILKEKVEKPTDIDGLVWIDHKEWDKKLVGELRDMGFKVDANNLI